MDGCGLDRCDAGLREECQFYYWSGRSTGYALVTMSVYTSECSDPSKETKDTCESIQRINKLL